MIKPIPIGQDYEWGQRMVLKSTKTKHHLEQN